MPARITAEEIATDPFSVRIIVPHCVERFNQRGLACQRLGADPHTGTYRQRTLKTGDKP
jgi:hypothetical protein